MRLNERTTSITIHKGVAAIPAFGTNTISAIRPQIMLSQPDTGMKPSVKSCIQMGSGWIIM